ncbi:MAG: hypothetical protein IMZ61_14050 [Planctomycetes bacterium]|nr:hypothetical protein [Planctomycetota bacterium]
MMVDTIKRGTICYYVARRTEIIDILAHGDHTPDYVKMLEGARDMATERIQQLQGIRLIQTAGVIVTSRDDHALARLLQDVLERKQSKTTERVE